MLRPAERRETREDADACRDHETCRLWRLFTAEDVKGSARAQNEGRVHQIWAFHHGTKYHGLATETFFDEPIEAGEEFGFHRSDCCPSPQSRLMSLNLA